jgi:hypothetical protein
LFWADCFAGAVMVVAAIVEVFLGVKAERQSLESIATPLSEVLQPEVLQPEVLQPEVLQPEPVT